MKLDRIIPMMLMLPALSLMNGCATKALWSNAYLDAFNEPAEQANLRLFDARRQKDLLVIYDEYSERSGRIRPRAYFLEYNQRRIEQGCRPRFESTNLMSGLNPVSMVCATNVGIANPPQMFYAIVSTNNQSFALYSGDSLVSFHALPVYNDGRGTVGRVCLTPIAVAADVTLVGGVLGYWWLEGMAQSGYSIDCP